MLLYESPELRIEEDEEYAFRNLRHFTDTISKISDIDERELVTVFVGKDVSEDERVAMTEALEDSFPELEVQVYIGEQRVYGYILAIE